MAGKVVRLREAQQRIVEQSTDFLDDRPWNDRLDWVLMDYQRMKVEQTRPRRDSNPVSADFEGFEPSYRNEAFSEAIRSHEHALLA